MTRNYLEIRRINESLENQLFVFFQGILSNNDDFFFHPHPFTKEIARNISYYSGEDLYYALTKDGEILGYGMLRGWDEGYEIPSLGIIIHHSVRMSGLGRLFLLFLHQAAKNKGSKKIRLKVHASNSGAFSLYQSLGYIFQKSDNDELIGLYEFS